MIEDVEHRDHVVLPLAVGQAGGACAREVAEPPDVQHPDDTARGWETGVERQFIKGRFARSKVVHVDKDFVLN